MPVESPPPAPQPAAHTVIPAPPPLPPGPPPAPAAPPADDPNSTVTIPLGQLQTFTKIQERLARLEEEKRISEEQARTEQVKLLAKNGEIENALRMQREEAEKQLNMERTQRASLEERAKAYALEGELSRTLAAYQFVSPAAQRQAANELRQNLMVEPQGNGFLVRTPTFQSVTDYVAAQLALPDYAHCLRAAGVAGTAGGGSSAASSSPTPPANPAAPDAPRTLGEAVILHMQSMQGKSASLDPRYNMGAPMGLRRSS